VPRAARVSANVAEFVVKHVQVFAQKPHDLHAEIAVFTEKPQELLARNKGRRGLLARFGGDVRRIYHAHVAEIASVYGVGQNTAVRIKAALSLGMKLQEPADEHTTINSPADAAALVMHEMSLLQQEYLKVILLDRRNHVLDIVEVYHGSVNSSQVRIAEIFKPAIQRMSPALICCHNHPSGDATPSPDDVAVTRAMVQAGKLLDIDVLDHLVIGNGRFVSLKERGLGFS